MLGAKSPVSSGSRTAVPERETDEERDEAEAEGDDILAGSPDFVEEGEDEDLWFEKGPPKDFDFEEDDGK